MGISLTQEAFYCYRDPNRHSGRGFVSLLIRLGQTRDEAIRLLNFHRDRSTPRVQIEAAPDLAKLASAWDRFALAARSQRCLDYLAARGFESPATLCEQYDLRYSPEGIWAQRLLIPLHKDGEVISWTGRDVTERLEVKYLSKAVAGYQMVYTPDAHKPNRDTAVLVEGPLDALRLSAATRRQPYVTIALCGKGLGAQKLLAIQKASDGCSQFLVALDADVQLSLCYQVIAEVASVVKMQFVGRGKLPPGFKDPGELPMGEILPWLNETVRIMKSNYLGKRDQR